jgi:antitoxin Phd
MLSKCANPSCSTPLVYLREGRIFAFPVAEELVEHFWLCGPCSVALTLRDSERGVQVVPRGKIAIITAQDTKNEFGRVLQQVIKGDTVVITEHDTPKAVLMPLEEFNALSNATEFRADILSNESDALLIRMQTPANRAAMKAAFDASPEELGKSAVAEARRRG